jgi:hypothetical protein
MAAAAAPGELKARKQTPTREFLTDSEAVRQDAAGGGIRRKFSACRPPMKIIPWRLDCPARAVRQFLLDG